MPKSSHAQDSEKPTPGQFRELFAQVESGQVTRGRLQAFLAGEDSRSVNLTEAADILGSGNFFGPNQWVKFFGKKFSLPKVPKIPWTYSQLIKAEAEHLLFLAPYLFAGKPLTLRSWYRVLGPASHPMFDHDWAAITDEICDAVADTRWYLMPRSAIHGLLPGGYERPTTLARVLANSLYYLLNGEYFDTGSWVRTSDKYPSGAFVTIRAFSETGIALYKPTGVTKSNMGDAASRIF